MGVCKGAEEIPLRWMVFALSKQIHSTLYLRNDAGLVISERRLH
jgi:hypothetical protein